MNIRPEEHTCWLLLTRHGATENNRARPPRLQGRGIDCDLSEPGRAQAQQTGRFLRDLPLEAVFSSPMRRALQTAEAVASPHGLAPQTVDQLIEVDVGLWEGRNWEDIQQAYPEAYQAFMADAGNNPYCGGENLSQLQARVVPALDRLLEENVGRVIAVAAHNVVNRVYLARLLAIPLSGYRSIPQDNCGVSVLRWRRGDIKVVTINSVWHLQ
jgi:broad specificity phosphatase PhoE